MSEKSAIIACIFIFCGWLVVGCLQPSEGERKGRTCGAPKSNEHGFVKYGHHHETAHGLAELRKRVEQLEKALNLSEP